MALNKNIILETDGTIITNGDLLDDIRDDFSAHDDEENEIFCEICNFKFETEKMLRLHIETKHIPSTVVYQCPTCSKTFSQPSAVIKHLCNDHNKSLRKIRHMRENIYKKRSRIDEIQIKGPSRELIQLQIDKPPSKVEQNKEKSELNSLCPYCGKTFERRAVLVGHINGCLIKSKSKTLNKTIKSTITSSGSSSTNEKILENEEVALDDVIGDNGGGIGNDIEVKEEEEEVPIVEQEETRLVPPLKIKTTNKRKRKIITLETVTPPDTPKKMSVVEEEVSPPPSIDIKFEKTLQCDICEKKFLKSSNLKRHIAMFHYRMKNFSCKLCEFRGYRRYDISNHLTNIHQEQESIKTECLNDYIGVIKNGVERSKQVLRNNNNDERRNVGTISSIGAIVGGGGGVSKKKTVSKSKPTTTDLSLSNPTLNISNQSTSDTILAPVEQPRHSSNTTTSILPTTITLKRPIRNRIKPIQKDFVYDLSNLLKKECSSDQAKEYRLSFATLKIPKRRQTLDEPAPLPSTVQTKSGPPTPTTGTPPPPVIQVKPLLLPFSIPKLEKFDDDDVNDEESSKFKYAAFEMAKVEVIKGNACFRKHLELSVTPTKIIETRRSDPSVVPPVAVIEMVKKSNSIGGKRLSDRKIKNLTLGNGGGGSGRSSSSFKKQIDRKSILISRPLDFGQNKKSSQSVVTTTASSSPELVIESMNDEGKIPIELPTEKEFQRYLVTNRLTEPIKKIVVEVPERTTMTTSGEKVDGVNEDGDGQQSQSQKKGGDQKIEEI